MSSNPSVVPVPGMRRPGVQTCAVPARAVLAAGVQARGVLGVGALGLAVLLSACGTPPVGAPVTPSTTTAATAGPTPSTAGTALADPPPAGPETGTAARGTQQNPARPDVDTVTLDEAGVPAYDVMLSAADFAADDVVAGHHALNPPAPDGSTYVVLPLTATYRGAGTAEAWLDLEITFVAADGRTVEQSDALVPDDLMITSELATGESVRANLPFVVPDDALTGGTWTVVLEGDTGPVTAFYAAL